MTGEIKDSVVVAALRSQRRVHTNMMEAAIKTHETALHAFQAATAQIQTLGSEIDELDAAIEREVAR